MQTMELREAPVNQSSAIQAVEGSLNNCKFLGLESSNVAAIIPGALDEFGEAAYETYKYAESALEKAATLYVGIPVYFNHPVQIRQPDGSVVTTERDGRTFLGYVTESRYVPGDGVRGSISFPADDPDAKKLKWISENCPHVMGFSHIARANLELVEGRVTVSEITDPKSLDLVTDPATTNGLYESRSQEMFNTAKKKTQTLAEALKTIPKGTRYLRRLREMADEGMVDPTAVEVEPEASPEDKVKQGIIEALVKKMEEDSEFLKSVMDLAELDPLASVSGGGDAEGEEMPESKQALTEQRLLKAENELLRAGVTSPTAAMIRALSGAQAGDRRELLEAFTAGTEEPAPLGHRPPKSPPKPLQESYGDEDYGFGESYVPRPIEEIEQERAARRAARQR